MKKIKLKIFTDKNELLERFCSDLSTMVSSITIDDCKSILEGNNIFLQLDDDNQFNEIVVNNIIQKFRIINKGGVLNHTTFKLSDLDLEMIKHVPQGGSWKDIPVETVKKSQRLVRITQTGGRTTLYGRIDYLKPVYTITTYFNRPGNGTYVHPIHERVISVREAARFQTFPDEYYFYGNKSDKLKQVGNAVPCLLAYCLGKSIVKKTGCKTSVDLFSGAGGMTYGFKRAGINSVIANDIIENACITLKTNVPDTNILCGDITSEIIKEEIIKTGKKGKADIICGGPPCQGFSMAGFRNEKDPRNMLFKPFVEIVSKVNPKVIVFENVEGILSYQKGETYRNIIQLFSELGYNCEGRKVYANHYGVPQRRKRVIILCIRKDLNISPSDIFPKSITPNLDKQTTAFETIYDLENVECSESNTYYNSEYSSSILKYFKGESSIDEYLKKIFDNRKKVVDIDNIDDSEEIEEDSTN